MRQEPTNKLDPKVKSVWRLSGAIVTIIFGAIAFAAAAILSSTIEDYDSSGIYYYLAAIVTVVLLITNMLVTPALRYIRWRFAVLDDEIDIYRGIIVRKRIIVPLIRVQYTDTTQGPLMRAFGLANVRVYTAAGAQSIEGLAASYAESLRDKVAILAKQVQEDV